MMIFVCSPYRGSISENVAVADHLCSLAVQCGHIPIAPHLWLTRWLDDSVEAEREKGIRMSMEMLRRCDRMLVWTASGITEGMTQEIKYAQECQVERVYVKTYSDAERVMREMV